MNLSFSDTQCSIEGWQTLVKRSDGSRIFLRSLSRENGAIITPIFDNRRVTKDVSASVKNAMRVESYVMEREEGQAFPAVGDFDPFDETLEFQHNVCWLISAMRGGEKHYLRAYFNNYSAFYGFSCFAGFPSRDAARKFMKENQNGISSCGVSHVTPSVGAVITRKV